MATYTLTTGIDTLSLSGQNTVIASAATLNAGDSLGGPGTYIVQTQGGGLFDFTGVATKTYGTTIVTDDSSTQILLGTSGGYGVQLGNGADTLTGSGSGSFSVSYASQAQLAGDSIHGSAGLDSLYVSSHADLTALAHMDGIESLQVLGNDLTLRVNDTLLHDVTTIGSTGHLTIATGEQSMDLSHIGLANWIDADPYPSTYSLLGTNAAGTAFILPTSTYIGALTTIEGQGNHDVVITAAGRDLSGKTLIGIEALDIHGSVTVDQTIVASLHAIEGQDAFNSVTVKGSFADFSGVTMTNVSFINAGFANGIDITGSNSNETISTSSYADTLSGGAGNDQLQAGAGADVLHGGAGNDTLLGGAGLDTMDGGPGSDLFSGSAADLDGDTIMDFAASGADTIRLNGFGLTITADRTVSFANGDLIIDPDGGGSQAPVTIHLGGSYAGTFAMASTGYGLDITYQAPVLPTPGDDNLTGTAGSDTIDALGGNDAINGLAGNDSLTGSNGNDTILGGDGNDTVMGLNDNDSVLGGNGDDLVRGGNGADYVDGGAGNDAVWGDPGNDTLVGGTGADRFFFIAGYGHDQVLDFNYADGDRIRLDKALSVASIADDTDGDAVITTNEGSTITLVGHHASEVQSGWIGL